MKNMIGNNENYDDGSRRKCLIIYLENIGIIKYQHNKNG